MKEPITHPGVSNWTLHRLENTLTDLKEIMERGHPRETITSTIHGIAVELLERCKRALDREAWTQGALACDNCADLLPPSAERCPNCRRAAPF